MDINYRKTIFHKVASKVSECPETHLPEVVLAGRSNVGKSSFINALGDNKKLAKVSSTPGKTQLVVYFITDGKIIFSDLPGYGYTKTSKKNDKKFKNLVDNYFNSGREFFLVIHFMDIRHDPSIHDILMKEWMDSKGMEYIIVLTKADKMAKTKLKNRTNQIRKAMDLDAHIPIFPFSATNKTGLNEIRNEINSRLTDN